MRYIDSNIFIYHIDKNADLRFKKRAKKILRRVEKGEKVVSSFITFMEVMWWCEREQKKELKKVLDCILSYLSLSIIQLTPAIIDNAILFKEKYGLELNDCVALALMTNLEVKEIYSNDAGFDKVEWVKRVFG